jgi:hypothetical protein
MCYSFEKPRLKSPYEMPFLFCGYVPLSFYPFAFRVEEHYLEDS